MKLILKTMERINNRPVQIRDPLSREKIFRTRKKGNQTFRIMKKLKAMLCNKLRRMILRARRRAKTTSEAARIKRTNQTASNTRDSRFLDLVKATKLQFTLNRQSIVMRTTMPLTTSTITMMCLVEVQMQMMITSQRSQRMSPRIRTSHPFHVNRK
jgi:hypothetical protein